MMLMLFVFVYLFFLIFSIKAYVVGTHFNCIKVFILFFFLICYKSICCGYSFELHRQVYAIQMDTHNICLYKELDKSTLAEILRLQNCLTVCF